MRREGDKSFRVAVPERPSWQTPFIKQLPPLENPTPVTQGPVEKAKSRESPLPTTASLPAPEIQPDVAAVLEKSGALGKPGHGESGRRKKEQVQSHLPI